MKDMKRLIGITGIILIAYTILSAVLLPAGESALTDNPRQQAAESGAMFTARESGDRIAIYAGENLIARTDTSVSSLPNIDRIRLREGIEFDSEKELKQFLEDYCS